MRHDVGKILARSGVELEAQIELGVLRAGRTGLAGPVQLISERGQLDFSGIKGPTDVRLDQPALRLTTHADVLLVVENRQAAEVVSDGYPHVALVWTQGAMGEESLHALGQLAAQVARSWRCRTQTWAACASRSRYSAWRRQPRSSIPARSHMTRGHGGSRTRSA